MEEAPYFNGSNILMRLLESVSLTGDQYTDLMSLLYFGSTAILVAMGILFLSFKATQNFDQRYLFSGHWFFMALHFLGALLALQNHAGNNIGIPSYVTSFFSQSGLYLSVIFFGMGLWEMFHNYRFKKENLWVVIGSVAIFSAALQVVFSVMTAEDRFFYKVVPQAAAVGVCYLVLGFYFCPCMNNRFSFSKKFMPSYTLNIPMILFGVTQLILAALFASKLEYDFRYNTGALLLSLQLVWKVLMGVGLLKLALLMEAQNSARVENLVNKNKNYALVGQLSAGFVHDINNSVSVMSLSTDLANKEFEKGNHEKAISYLEMMKTCSNKVTNLAKQISDVIRSHQGGESQQIAFNPNEIIRIMQPALLVILPSSVQLKLDLDLSFQKSIFSSTTDFEMVLLNLVKNSAAAIDSAEHSYDSGLIVVRTRRVMMDRSPVNGSEYGEIEAVSIVVEDNGCGIPADQLDKVGKFGFSTKGDNGTGIGLANVARYAEENGGNFYIRSIEGESTQIEIQIPVNEKVQEGHVVVVADNPDIARDCRSEEWKVLALTPASFNQVCLSTSGGVLVVNSEDDSMKDLLSQKLSELPVSSSWRVLRVVNDVSAGLEEWPLQGVSSGTLHRRHTPLELQLEVRKLMSSISSDLTLTG